MTELLRGPAKRAGPDALGLASWAVAHPEEPSDVQALRLMNLVWRGLESLQQGDVWLPPEWRPADA